MIEAVVGSALTAALLLQSEHIVVGIVTGSDVGETVIADRIMRAFPNP